MKLPSGQPLQLERWSQRGWGLAAGRREEHKLKERQPGGSIVITPGVVLRVLTLLLLGLQETRQKEVDG